jgi:hypothetical protein
VDAIGKLMSALNALAENVLALAVTLEQTNAGLRQRLALDTTPAETPVVTHQVAQDGTDGSEEAGGPAGRPRGRRKGTETA